jgi:hypothetical protein
MSGGLPFAEPSERLDIAQLRRIARAVAERRDLWEEELRRSRDNRTYVDVFSNEHLGVWAISWMADGHDTGYHDHDASRGAVHVAEGAIRHEHLTLDGEPTGSCVAAGDGFEFDDTAIHRMRREPGAGPTVTVHAYSPPLVRTGQYAQQSDGLLHRVPTRAEEQLKPKGPQGEGTASA